MAGFISCQTGMSGNRDVGSSITVMEPKLINRSNKRVRSSAAKEVPTGTQQLAIPITVDSDKDNIPSTQPNSPVLNGIPAGNSEEGHRESVKHRRVLQTLCDRIEEIQRGGGDANPADEIFTMPLQSTPRLSELYNEAADGIVSDDGLRGPSAIGVLLAEEKSIQEALDAPEELAEKIIRAWGFNFNDTHYNKKRNLYHVIYTDDHIDFMYLDLNSRHVLGWASHVKCKSGNVSRFSGRIHTHNLVASATPYHTRKVNYDRDYKTIVRSFYKSVPGSCSCQRVLDRTKCNRCNEHSIKVKLVNTSSYFINVTKYILSIYQEEQVATGEFVATVPEER